MTFRNVQVKLSTNVRAFSGEMQAAGRSVDTFQRKLDSAEKQGPRMEKSTSLWTKALIGGVALAAVALGVFVGKAIGFEREMRNVSTISQTVRDDFEGVSKTILQMSTRLPQDAATMARGLYDIASSGFAGAEGLTVLDAANKAASAGLSTTAVAAKGMTAVLNAYGLSAASAGDVSDIMFQTVNLGVITFEELSSVIGDVIGTAAQAKVSFAEVGGALATMTLSGINGSEAATSLNRVFQSIIQPSEALKTQLKALGYESGAAALEQDGLRGVLEKVRIATGGNITTLLELFPEIRAARGALALMANEGENWARVSDQITDKNKRAGSTAAALAEQAKGLGFQIDIAKNRINAFGIEVGLRVIPVVRGFVDVLMGSATFLAEHQGLLKGIGIVLSALLIPKLVAATSATLALIAAKLGLNVVQNDLLGGTRALTLGFANMIANMKLSTIAMNAAGLAATAALGLIIMKMMEGKRQAKELAQTIRTEIGDVTTFEESSKAVNRWSDELAGALGEADEEIARSGGKIGFAMGGLDSAFTSWRLTPKLNELSKGMEEASKKGLTYAENIITISRNTNRWGKENRIATEQMAKQLGVDLFAGGKKGEAAVEAVSEAFRTLGHEVGLSGNAIQSFVGGDLEAAQNFVKAIDEAGKKASETFMGSVDVIKALGNEQDITAAKIKKFYADTLKDSGRFVELTREAITQGLDPQLVARLLQAGPAEATPILEAMVGKHSAGLIDIVNKSEAALMEVNSSVVQMARLTQRAVSATTDEMANQLPVAMKIVQLNMAAGGAASMQALVDALKIPEDEIRKIAEAFGITLTGAIERDLRGRAIPISLKNTGYSVSTSVIPSKADGGIVRFAQEGHVAQVARAGEWRVWAEPETGGEAYIPLGMNKRGRSTQVLSAVASEFGYGLRPMQDGGMMLPLGRSVGGDGGVNVTYQFNITGDNPKAIGAEVRRVIDAHDKKLATSLRRR